MGDIPSVKTGQQIYINIFFPLIIIIIVMMVVLVLVVIPYYHVNITVAFTAEVCQ